MASMTFALGKSAAIASTRVQSQRFSGMAAVRPRAIGAAQRPKAVS